MHNHEKVLYRTYYQSSQKVSSKCKEKREKKLVIHNQNINIHNKKYPEGISKLGQSYYGRYYMKGQITEQSWDQRLGGLSWSVLIAPPSRLMVMVYSASPLAGTGYHHLRTWPSSDQRPAEVVTFNARGAEIVERRDNERRHGLCPGPGGNSN